MISQHAKERAREYALSESRLLESDEFPANSAIILQQVGDYVLIAIRQYNAIRQCAVTTTVIRRNNTRQLTADMFGVEKFFICR